VSHQREPNADQESCGQETLEETRPTTGEQRTGGSATCTPHRSTSEAAHGQARSQVSCRKQGTYSYPNHTRSDRLMGRDQCKRQYPKSDRAGAPRKHRPTPNEQPAPKAARSTKTITTKRPQNEPEQNSGGNVA